MAEETIVVTGKPEEIFTCITSPTRPNPWHCWERAALHILTFKDCPWRSQVDSAALCDRIAQVVYMQPRPPRRAVEPIRWGWGNFPHLGIDKRRR